MIAFLDTETTGFTRTDHVLEVACAVVSNDGRRVIKLLSSLLPARSGSEQEVQRKLQEQWNNGKAVHGILTQDVVGNTELRTQVLQSLVLLLQNCDTIVGHNIEFDLRMLAQCTTGADGAWLRMLKEGRLSRVQVIDTMKDGRPQPQWESLENLSRRLGSGRLDKYAHSALGDCLRLLEVWPFLPVSARVAEAQTDKCGDAADTERIREVGVSQVDVVQDCRLPADTKHKMLTELGFRMVVNG